MKYYIRQIRPYVQPPALQGMLCVSYPVKGYDWAPEDLEEQLRSEIVLNDPWSKLIFQERFVEVDNNGQI